MLDFKIKSPVYVSGLGAPEISRSHCFTRQQDQMPYFLLKTL